MPFDHMSLVHREASFPKCDGDFAEWVDFAYWWRCVGKRLCLHAAQQACLINNIQFLGTVHKLCQPKMAGSRPPLPPLSAIFSISQTPPPLLLAMSAFAQPRLPFARQFCEHHPD